MILGRLNLKRIAHIFANVRLSSMNQSCGLGTGRLRFKALHLLKSVFDKSCAVPDGVPSFQVSLSRVVREELRKPAFLGGYTYSALSAKISSRRVRYSPKSLLGKEVGGKERKPPAACVN